MIAREPLTREHARELLELLVKRAYDSYDVLAAISTAARLLGEMSESSADALTRLIDFAEEVTGERPRRQ
jgi:hypothetical protein